MPRPSPASGPGTAVLALADGTIFRGLGIGATGAVVGEVCFNTSMTGYQEILTDPSYAGQMITFTFPHVGNVGTNNDDCEAPAPAARGLILRANITEPSNWRAGQHLDAWLKVRNLVGIAGIDTRQLTRHLRRQTAQDGAIQHAPSGNIDADALIAEAKAWPGIDGMDLAKEVTCQHSYIWEETEWSFERQGGSFGHSDKNKHHVVAMDFGAKRNILRSLASRSCRLTIVPATSSFDDIMAHEPDGVFLSNGPGDPAATSLYAGPTIEALIACGKPVFGICLGHQLLGLALGARTTKMPFGHRGANHPVKDLETSKVEITSQNHGFEVLADSLPPGVTATHISLFDGTLEGLKVDGKPVFSVQYHPEASPGPQDAAYLFDRFIGLMNGAN